MERYQMRPAMGKWTNRGVLMTGGEIQDWEDLLIWGAGLPTKTITTIATLMMQREGD